MRRVRTLRWPRRHRGGEIEELVERAGGRVGLAGVLADLRRAARPANQQLTRLERSFTWEERDCLDQRWWPQGVTGSWDRGPGASGDVLVTTAYAKQVNGVGLGSRITVHDLSAGEVVPYDHVLLVRAERDDRGRLRLTPLHAHAGGAAWVGEHLHVAATEDGVHTFDLADIVPAPEDPDDATARLGLPRHGHRFLLPVTASYRPKPARGRRRRYSFLSVCHSPEPVLVAGEYGVGDMTTRLWEHDLDPDTGLIASDARSLPIRGVQHMQGVVRVEDRLHLVTSRGRYRRGSIWTQAGDRFVEHEHALPPGPEDLSHDPATDRLWTLTEYPFLRLVAAVDRSRFL